jgi:hypothetical protein
LGQTDFDAWLDQRPFRAFRIVMSDGKTYEVRHPDQVMPTFSAVVLPYPSPAPGGPPAGEFITLSLFHVIRLEPLAQPTSGDGQG